MNLQELYDLVRKMVNDGTALADVNHFLDREAEKRPELLPAVNVVKGTLGPLFDQANIGETLNAAIAEVRSLLKNKYGVVSDAPEIGLA